MAGPSLLFNILTFDAEPLRLFPVMGSLVQFVAKAVRLNHSPDGSAQETKSS